MKEDFLVCEQNFLKQFPVFDGLIALAGCFASHDQVIQLPRKTARLALSLAPRLPLDTNGTRCRGLLVARMSSLDELPPHWIMTSPLVSHFADIICAETYVSSDIGIDNVRHPPSSIKHPAGPMDVFVLSALQTNATGNVIHDLFGLHRPLQRCVRGRPCAVISPKLILEGVRHADICAFAVVPL